jgi:hypothetical protein
MSDDIANEPDPSLLAEIWQGWYQITISMKTIEEEQVQIAKERIVLGFTGINELWRDGYDMPADVFAFQLRKLRIISCAHQPKLTQMSQYIRSFTFKLWRTHHHIDCL